MTIQEIHGFARGVARNYCRAWRMPELHEEATQEAWVAIASALPAYDPDKGSMKAFLARAIVWRLGDVLRRASAWDRQRASETEWQQASGLARRGFDAARVEDGMARADEELARLEWCGRVQAVAVSALRGLPDADAALAVLSGTAVPVVCRQHRCNPRRVKRAIVAARARLATIEELHQLYLEAA